MAKSQLYLRILVECIINEVLFIILNNFDKVLQAKQANLISLAYCQRFSQLTSLIISREVGIVYSSPV